jgi:hypothetical protein
MHQSNSSPQPPTAGSAWGSNPLESNTWRTWLEFKNWPGRDGNDPSVDIAKDGDQRF